MNRKLHITELDRLRPEEFKKAEKHPIVILLDNIRSHHNVGSIFRTADAFRVERVLICGITPAPPHKDIRKTALGADETVDWESGDAEELIRIYRQQGYKVFAVEQTEKSTPLQDFNVEQDGVLLILGNEVEGVDQRLIDLCDGSIEIPQQGTKHSLNVSVCCGIVLWHAFHQLNER